MVSPWNAHLSEVTLDRVLISFHKYNMYCGRPLHLGGCAFVLLLQHFTADNPIGQHNLSIERLESALSRTAEVKLSAFFLDSNILFPACAMSKALSSSQVY